MTTRSLRDILVRAAWTAPVFTVALLAGVAAGAHRSTKTLPYYGDATFTPRWARRGHAPRVEPTGAARFTLADQSGATVTDRDVAGRVRVVNFFYAACGDICPITRERLKAVATRFAGDSRVVILSHTVTPHADSAGALAAYAAAKGIPSSGWRLLTGPDSTLDRLAVQAYHLKAPTSARSWGVDSIAHTERVVLVDQAGYLRGVYNGTLALEMEHLAADISTLLAAPVR